jgi:hypothetical protein
MHPRGLIPFRLWFLLLVAPSTAFDVVVEPRRAILRRAVTQVLEVPGTRVALHHKKSRRCYMYKSSILYGSLSNDDDVDSEEEIIVVTPTDTSAAAPQASPSSIPSPPSRAKLDPLLVAVTKMDPQSAPSRSMSIPIWGELILDRSLFVLLPIAVFAIGGIFLSLFVLINSGDTFVDAIVENALQQSVPTPAIADDECRGLCSSQTQDLEGLRVFMNRLGGK